VSALALRHAAALRLEPLPSGERDPLHAVPRGLHVVPEPEDGPFGLTRRELAAEIARCRARGFQQWEIERVFAEVGTR
jgi:hypothetical protein